MIEVVVLALRVGCTAGDSMRGGGAGVCAASMVAIGELDCMVEVCWTCVHH